MLFVYFLASPTAHDQLQAVPPSASHPPPPSFVPHLSRFFAYTSPAASFTYY